MPQFRRIDGLPGESAPAGLQHATGFSKQFPGMGLSGMEQSDSERSGAWTAI